MRRHGYRKHWKIRRLLPRFDTAARPRHHTAIADEHHALEPEALLRVIAQLGDRLGIAPIAVKDMESDRPAIDHNEADQHLRIARLPSLLWPLVSTPSRTALPLEIGRGQIVEYHVDF
jgi:hypothetical protein